MNDTPAAIRAAHTRLALDRVPSFLPGSADYAAATSPENLSVVQTPALVAHPGSAQELATVVTAAGATGTTMSVQATGHGAARALGSDTLLIDTSALTEVRIDPEAEIAYVGAGARWGAVQRAAAQHGLLGLAGTSPGVGVAGYTFGGGIGWFARSHGLAAGRLRAVRYVDGKG